MILSNVPNTKVVDVLSLTNSTDFKLVELPDSFNEPTQDNAEDMCFSIFDIVHFAVVKTDDNEIRNCICYLNEGLFLEWMDLEFIVRECFIINYNSYLDTMRNINQKPLDLPNFIIQKYKGTDCSIPSNDLKLNCSINQFKNELSKETKFNLVEIVDGYYK